MSRAEVLTKVKFMLIGRKREKEKLMMEEEDDMVRSMHQHKIRELDEVIAEIERMDTGEEGSKRLLQE